MQRIAYAAQYWEQIPDPVPIKEILEEPLSVGAFTLMVLAVIAATASALCLGFAKPPPGHDIAKFGELHDSGKVSADGPNGRTVMASLDAHFFTSRKLREAAAAAAATSAGALGSDISSPAGPTGARIVAGSVQHGAELEELASVTQRVFSGVVTEP
jgi:hypothetical protein